MPNKTKTSSKKQNTPGPKPEMLKIEAGSVDLWFRSAAFCCRLGTNRSPSADGLRYSLSMGRRSGDLQVAMA